MIVIRQSERRLYYVIGGGAAIRYPVAIGTSGTAWQGEAYIEGKYMRPDWSAPTMVRQDHPNFPSVIPGGSPRNPWARRRSLCRCPKSQSMAQRKACTNRSARPPPAGASACSMRMSSIFLGRRGVFNLLFLLRSQTKPSKICDPPSVRFLRPNRRRVVQITPCDKGVDNVIGK